MNNPNYISATNRADLITKLRTETYDLLVIGGGVTGAGIALDASARGLKTALVEKLDFASGTSSKSTKLIHGGLRYLKQLDFALVRETGTERAVVHKLAPHLVLPEKMILPLIDGGTYGKTASSFGLMVYDVLANVKGDDRRKMLSKKETLKLEPLLDESVLKGCGFYAEYRTDDARLTIELIKTANRYNAKTINYCQATDFIYDDNGIVKAVECHDTIKDEHFIIKAKKVVSAAGPWVDHLRRKDQSLKGKRLQLTKGVHIVVPKEKLPINYTVYFDVPGGRMVFAIPRGRITYVGTTDTIYKDSLDRVLATKADVDYILNAANNAFPSINLEESDVLSSWAGLRPLIHEDGKSASELSRKDEIFDSKTGLISIAGGKLTGYRKMSQRVVDKVVEQLEKEDKRDFKKCSTNKISLTENPLKNNAAVQAYILEMTKKVNAYNLDDYFAWYLVTTYGKAAETILSKLPSFKENDPEIALARAELHYCVHNEMVNAACDYFVRRTGRLFFEIESIAKIRQAIFADLQTYLNWTENDLKVENELLDQLIFDASHFMEEETLVLNH